MTTEFTYKTAFTHGGKFHADDVFSTALLRILNPDIEIIRGFQIPEGFDGIVYDIGMGEFDHHQKEKRIRTNGIPYAAFGLLWERYGCLLLEEEQARKLENNLVEPIDRSDNSPEANPLSDAIGWMNPSYDETEKTEECFWRAVEMAKQMLEAGIHKLKKAAQAVNTVKAAIEKSDGKTLILESFCPWRDAVKETTIDFVIFPSQRGGYNVCSVPSDQESGEQKIRFPERLGGITQEELEKETGIPGFRFCHPGGFICAADTLETAVAIAEWTRSNG
ncbi:MAG: MYG1 family protein [Lachnospiraceae bacterium]|nr:MYG1 family protein [Lachnospiraceae bacterium]